MKVPLQPPNAESPLLSSSPPSLPLESSAASRPSHRNKPLLSHLTLAVGRGRCHVALPTGTPTMATSYNTCFWLTLSTFFRSLSLSHVIITSSTPLSPSHGVFFLVSLVSLFIFRVFVPPCNSGDTEKFPRHEFVPGGGGNYRKGEDVSVIFEDFSFHCDSLFFEKSVFVL